MVGRWHKIDLQRTHFELKLILAGQSCFSMGSWLCTRSEVQTAATDSEKHVEGPPLGDVSPSFVDVFTTTEVSIFHSSTGWRAHSDSTPGSMFLQRWLSLYAWVGRPKKITCLMYEVGELWSSSSFKSESFSCFHKRTVVVHVDCWNFWKSLNLKKERYRPGDWEWNLGHESNKSRISF